MQKAWDHAAKAKAVKILKRAAEFIGSSSKTPVPKPN